MLSLVGGCGGLNRGRYEVNSCSFLLVTTMVELGTESAREGSFFRPYKTLWFDFPIKPEGFGPKTDLKKKKRKRTKNKEPKRPKARPRNRDPRIRDPPNPDRIIDKSIILSLDPGGSRTLGPSLGPCFNPLWGKEFIFYF